MRVSGRATSPPTGERSRRRAGLQITLMQIRDYILETLDQTLIFSKYLNIPQSDILQNLHYDCNKLCNPLRNDKHPSLSFKYYGNKLICKDFADYRFRGDVFEIVGYILGKNCRDTEDFLYICNDIILRCSKNVISNLKLKQEEAPYIKNSNLDISFDIRKPNKIDFMYWERYGIRRENIGVKMFVVDRYRLNDWQSPYRYSGSDPCYVYNVNPNKYKLYFPYRNKHDTKFITNNRCPIECLHHIKSYNYICLIKGYKDKILLEQMCEDKGVTDILFLSTASETINLPKDIYSLLVSYSNSGKIFTMFDTDSTGIKSAKTLQDEYGIIPLYFTLNYKSKDPSDFVKDYSYSKALIQFDNVLNKIYYGNKT